MAATVISAAAWESGNITVPVDCTAVYLLWHYWYNADGLGLDAATLNSAAPDATHEIPGSSAGNPATGVCVWYNPPTGVQALVVDLLQGVGEGPVQIVVYVKDGNLTAWRDAKSDCDTGATEVTCTVTSVTGDLVLKLDVRYNAAAPSLSSGWTSVATQEGISGRSGRVSSLSAAGATTQCDGEDEYYSGVVAISIPAAGGGPSNTDVTPTIGSAAVDGAAPRHDRGQVSTVGAATLDGAAPTNDLGITVPTEVAL